MVLNRVWQWQYWLRWRGCKKGRRKIAFFEKKICALLKGNVWDGEWQWLGGSGVVG
jgi:hypothetical protein